MIVSVSNRIPDAATRILSISGKGDLRTSERLKQKIVQLIEDGVKLIILDVSKMDDIDSSGLAVIIFGFRRLNEIGGDLRLMAPNVRSCCSQFDIR